MGRADWQRRQIREFAQRVKRINVSGEDLPPLSVTKDLGVMLQSEKYKKRIATDPRKYVIAEKGEFVFDPMSLYYGSIGRQEAVARGLVSPDYVVFRTDDSVDPNFLHYLLRSPAQHAVYEANAEGGNQFGKRRRVYWSVFETLVLPLPRLVEQRKIASMLSIADDAVEKAQAVIDQVRVTRRAILDALVGRGFQNGWREVRLDEVAFIQTGVAKNTKDAAAGAVEVPYLRVANVQDGFVDLGELKTMRVDPGALERYALRGGDVLFTEGGDRDKLGRGCVWDGRIAPCLHQNHVFAVRPDSTQLLPEFLAYYAASTRGKAYFFDCAKQTTNLASINSSQLRAFALPVPPIEEQRELVEAVAAIDYRLGQENLAAQRLLEMRSALKLALLAGQLRVPLNEPTEAVA